MSLGLISTAYAAGGIGGGKEGGMGSFVLMIAIFIAVFYFMLLRPQNKRAKEQRDLISSLEKGDEVATTAGILGKIVKVDENYVVLSVSDNMELRFQKSAVATVLPKGTLKSI